MTGIDDLNLWHEDKLVGFLWKNDLDRIGFRYDNNWLTNESRFPISLQLPLGDTEFTPDEGVAHRFFSNLLPEGGARINIVNSLKIPNSDFALLRAIGGECAGALNILPYMSTPVPKSDWKYEKLSKERLTTLISRNGKIYSFNAKDDSPIRLSLAGAQDKCPVLMKEDEYFLPENEAPTSHILKFQIADFSHIPAYETVLMKLAGSLALPVADIELRGLDGLPADNPKKSFAVIKRYDRYIGDDDLLKRLHQEDFCQVLGYGYDKKYQADGGPSFADCLNMVRKISDEPIADSTALINWQIFNLLAGNSDGHAKNLSLLYSDNNSIRLAPFYDLVCTRAIDRIATSLAFAIGGQHDPGKITKNEWCKFAQENDIGQRYLLGLVKKNAEQIVENLPGVIEKFNNDYGTYSALQRVEKVIISQCKRTLKELI